jgi:hypothetical protein
MSKLTVARDWLSAEEDLTTTSKPPLLGVRARYWAIKSIPGHRTGSDVEREYEVHWELSWATFVTEDMKGYI